MHLYNYNILYREEIRFLFIIIMFNNMNLSSIEFSANDFNLFNEHLMMK